MNVLMVTHYFASNGGGIEIIADRLRDQLKSRGIRVRWLACTSQNRVTDSRPGDEDSVAIPAWDGIREATDLAFPLFSLRYLTRIWREVGAADIVHLHEPYYPLNQTALYFACLRGRPIVVTQHIADMPIRGLVRGRAVRIANWLMGRPAFLLARRIIYYSHRTAEYFHRWSKSKSVIIYNGCDADLFAPQGVGARSELRRRMGLPEDGVIALFVGRFIEKKGLGVLEQLVRSRVDDTFVFIGKGPMDPRQWGCANVVVLAPMPHENLCQYYRAANILVLPAVGEGFPLVVQEAMCTGIRCLVSSEVLEACPEVAPFLVDAGPAGCNVLQGYERAMTVPVTDGETNDRVAVSRSLWSWKRCADAYERVYCSLVNPL